MQMNQFQSNNENYNFLNVQKTSDQKKEDEYNLQNYLKIIPKNESSQLK